MTEAEFSAPQCQSVQDKLALFVEAYRDKATPCLRVGQVWAPDDGWTRYDQTREPLQISLFNARAKGCKVQIHGKASWEQRNGAFIDMEAISNFSLLESAQAPAPHHLLTMQSNSSCVRAPIGTIVQKLAELGVAVQGYRERKAGSYDGVLDKTPIVELELVISRDEANKIRVMLNKVLNRRPVLSWSLVPVDMGDGGPLQSKGPARLLR